MTWSKDTTAQRSAGVGCTEREHSTDGLMLRVVLPLRRLSASPGTFVSRQGTCVGESLIPIRAQSGSRIDCHSRWHVLARFPDKEEVRDSRQRGPTSPSVSVTRDELHEGVPLMKKILLLIATAAGVLAIQKKLKDQQAEQDLWAEATDEV